MELAEQVDPEEWHRILDRFFAIPADGVHRFEGTVNQYTGDGIMALFGAPIAHEHQRSAPAGRRSTSRTDSAATPMSSASRAGSTSPDFGADLFGFSLRAMSLAGRAWNRAYTGRLLDVGRAD